jgi:PAS domain S-box-containing protein
VDADCRFLEVNGAFCRMTGYSADELRDMRISDLEVDEHANGGVPSHTRTGLHQFPTAHRHKDGHLIYLELSVNVLHDDGTKILVGFARDMTERKRAAEELARLTREQRLVLDSAAEGIAAAS